MEIIESNSFNRLFKPRLKQALASGHSFLLFGPRQTGKSTLLEGIFDQLPGVLRYYFQLPSEKLRIESEPEILLREVEAVNSPKPVYLFVDEIQKVPRVMDVLQFLIDKKKAVVAASGSSARKMRTLGTNWLPGRVQLEHLYPLTWGETEWHPRELPQMLRYGALPGILSQPNLAQRESDLTAYTHLYLEEEIRLEAAVRNIPRFAKFLRLAALESGTAPNLSKIGGRVGLSHTTVSEYFQILEDSLIIHRLPAFGGSRDAVLRTAKYYFFDIGVRNAASGIGHSEGILTLQIGTLLEHFIVLEVTALFQGRARLSYWRTKQGQEVDLIVEHKDRRIAIEVKATERPNSDDFGGLEMFRQKYRCDHSYLVCQISRPQRFGSIEAIPWWEITERLKDLC